MRILVATDFSACSQAAVRLSGALARKGTAGLILLHAIEPPALDVTTIPFGLPEWEQSERVAAELRLAREASALREQGLVVETRVALGDPAKAIHDAVREVGADLVVVGTHGRKGTARLFLGSVATSVVRYASCPVLVTGQDAPNLERWAGQGPLRLAVAMDGSAAGQAALSWLRGFEASRACEISLVRLYWPAEEALRYGLDDPWGGRPRGPELARLIERDVLRDAATALGRAPSSVRLRIASNDSAEALAEEAAGLGVDGVVVGVPRHRSARWAVLSPGAVLRAASLPVLCVPGAAAAEERGLPRTRSILLATDFSDASRSAIPPAYGLLLAGGGHVELCTVHDLGARSAVDVPQARPLDDGDRADLEARLRSLIPAEAGAAEITTSVSVLEGRSVPEALVAAAERFDVDVVVLGSRGRSGFKRAVLGSVADEVARTSQRPVLIVGQRGRGARAA